MTSRFKISSKHDIRTLTIHVLICWNKVTLSGQVVPMCVQGSANPRTPGSENIRIKSCVLLPAAGRRTQLFAFIFSEPRVRGLADPCSYLISSLHLM